MISYNEQQSTHAPKVIMTGGGTLGHLMPGVAVAETMRQRWSGCDITFIISGEGAAREYVNPALKSRGFRVATVPAAKLESGKLKRGYSALKGAPRMTGGLITAMALVRSHNPDLVVGLGGYASVPVMIAAQLAGRSTALLEQNAYPGKANRFLSRWTDVVCCAWPGAEHYLPRAGSVMLTGNPIRREVVSARSAAPGLRNGDKLTLLVMGGSNGAAGVNSLVTRALPIFEKERDRMRIIHGAGKLGYEAVRKAYSDFRIEADVRPFIEDMAAAYGKSDLVISRAGGTSLAEVCAAAKPVVMIPFPYAADDHQSRNAECLTAAGAGVMLDEGQTTPEELAETVMDILYDETARCRMAEAAASLAAPDAADKVIDCLEPYLNRQAWKRGTA